MPIVGAKRKDRATAVGEVVPAWKSAGRPCIVKLIGPGPEQQMRQAMHDSKKLMKRVVYGAGAVVFAGAAVAFAEAPTPGGKKTEPSPRGRLFLFFATAVLINAALCVRPRAQRRAG